LIHSGQKKTALGRSETRTNFIGCQRLQRRLFHSGHSGHSVSGWPEWEPRTYWFAQFEPQRSLDMAAVGLKWSGGEEDLFSTHPILGFGYGLSTRPGAVSRFRWLGPPAQQMRSACGSETLASAFSLIPTPRSARSCFRSCPRATARSPNCQASELRAARGAPRARRSVAPWGPTRPSPPSTET
jgi:hypothetical protein